MTDEELYVRNKFKAIYPTFRKIFIFVKIQLHPLGKNIHTEGISPDILLKGNDDKDEENKVSLPEPYDKDKQLFDAIAIIKRMHVSSR